MEDHAKSLELVLTRFREHNLKIRLSKAKIATDKVTFLGYEISAKDGVRAGAEDLRQQERAGDDGEVPSCQCQDTGGIFGIDPETQQGKSS